MKSATIHLRPLRLLELIKLIRFDRHTRLPTFMWIYNWVIMKTRNRRYPRSSGMNGDKSGESGAFLFSRRVPDFCDGRRSFPTNENSNLYRRGRRRWISLTTDPPNCWAPVPLSRKFQFLAHFPFPPKFIGRIRERIVAIIRYIWDGRLKVKAPIIWDFPVSSLA